MMVVILACTFALFKGMELFEKETLVLMYGTTSTVPLLLDNDIFEYHNPMYDGRSGREGYNINNSSDNNNNDRNVNDNNSRSHYNIANFGSTGNGEEVGSGENKEGVDSAFEERNPMYAPDGSPKTTSRKVCCISYFMYYYECYYLLLCML
jgi:hypothetical protein